MAKTKKIEEMNVDELNLKLKDLKESIFNYRFQKALQQLEHPQKIQHIKKNIARVRTFINQYRLGIKK